MSGPQTQAAAAAGRCAAAGDAMSGLVIGVDVGGTKISAAAFGEDPVLVPTDCDGAEELIAQIVRQVRLVAGEREIAAVGVGIPSVIEFDSGRVRSSVNIPLEDVPLREELTERLGVPVFVDNDATLAALAEAHDEAGNLAAPNLVMLTVGTGVGGGIVIGGRVYRGATGGAGELGHTVIAADPDAAVAGMPAPGTPVSGTPAPGTPSSDAVAPGTPTPDPVAPGTPTPDPVVPGTPIPDPVAPGTPTRDSAAPGTPVGGFPRPGSLEALAAGHVLDALAREAAELHPESALGRLGTTATGPDAVAAARRGDAVAIAVLARLGRRLGIGIANAINTFDPDVVAIGGGVSAAGELLLGPAREAARGYVLPGVGTRTETRIARSGPAAGVRGAALLARIELTHHSGEASRV